MAAQVVRPGCQEPAVADVTAVSISAVMVPKIGSRFVGSSTMARLRREVLLIPHVPIGGDEYVVLALQLGEQTPLAIPATEILDRRHLMVRGEDPPQRSGQVLVKDDPHRLRLERDGELRSVLTVDGGEHQELARECTRRRSSRARSAPARGSRGRPAYPPSRRGRSAPGFDSESRIKSRLSNLQSRVNLGEIEPANPLVDIDVDRCVGMGQVAGVEDPPDGLDVVDAQGRC